MKNFIVLFVATFVVQACNSATVGDAEHQLKDLRELTTKKIQEAFTEHSRMSSEVDQVALSTKQRGLEEINKKTDKYIAKQNADKALTHRCRGTRDELYQHLKKEHSDDLIRCVDQQGSQSVNVLSTQRLGLVQYVWNAIYEEEKHIIVCGKSRNCLDAAVADIKDKVHEVAHVIHDEVQISRHNKEVQLQAIKGCASRSIANAELALSKVPTCTY